MKTIISKPFYLMIIESWW